jgi:hypothetical protein
MPPWWSNASVPANVAAAMAASMTTREPARAAKSRCAVVVDTS